MKYTGIIGVLSLILVMSNCNTPQDHSTSGNHGSLDSLEDSVSYAMGMGMAMNYAYFNGDDYRPEQMRRAVDDFINNKEFVLTEEEKNEVVIKYFKSVKQFKSDSLLRRSEQWLEKNKNEEGVFTTPRGLQYKFLTKGDGTGISPDGNDVVYVDYVQGSVYRGELWNQKMSTNPRDTIQLALNRELTGFSEGCQHMQVGDKMIMWLPPSIGSAEGRDPAGVSEKNEVIYIEVVLLDVLDRKTSNMEAGELSQFKDYFIDETQRND